MWALRGESVNSETKNENNIIDFSMYLKSKF